MAEVLKGDDKKTTWTPELTEYRELALEREVIRRPTLDERRMGWIPDVPDFRDFTLEHPEIKALLTALKVPLAGPAPLSGGPVDLRLFCSPVEDQRQIGSCTAQAGVGLLEYYERRAFSKHIDGSRMFLYYVTRRLLGWHGDTGAYVRTTMGGMVLFGVPHEKYWPYLEASLDIDPPQFVYALAQNYQAVKYYRFDPPSTVYNNAFLNLLKGFLTAKLPMMLGFSVYRDAIRQAEHTGRIPVPSPMDTLAGGHAVDIVGFDDTVKITNTAPKSPEFTGAFLIRNSWGPAWGLNGYGYLPYEYVLRGLTRDYWSLISAEWIDTGQFGC